MKKRIWAIRLTLLIGVSIISLFISILMQGPLLTYYINTSFILGLIFLIITGISFIIFFGFFTVFVEGWKKLYYTKDPYEDKSHWSYDKKITTPKQGMIMLRQNAKYELFLFLPLFLGFSLLVQSFTLLYLFSY